MRKLLLGGLAWATLALPASAVEITPGTEVQPPADNPAYNWSGVYGRLNAIAPYESLMFGTPSSGAANDTLSSSSQFGYNYQSGSLVFGVETDLTKRGGSDFANLLGTSGTDALSGRNEQGWIGTLRPRAGVAADNWLFYGTGGLAYGSVSSDNRAFNSTRTGWTIGGGVEFADGKQWSLGLEYLYADFGKSSPSQPSTNFSMLGPIEDRSQILRGKLNYKFGWGEVGK